MGGKAGQDAAHAAAQETEGQSDEERIGHLDRRPVGHAEQHGLQHHCRPHGHGLLQPGLDDPAEHQLLRQRACHGDGQRRDQAGRQQELHMVVIVGQPHRRQQRQRQPQHHEQPHSAEGAEGCRPAGAAAQPRRFPQRLMPQPEPQQYRRRSQQVSEEHGRLRTGKNTSSVRLSVEQRRAGDSHDGINDARQKLDCQKEQQVQQGLAQRGQDALCGICAFGFHVFHSFLSDASIPSPRPIVYQPQVASAKTAQPQVVIANEYPPANVGGYL